LSSKDGDGGDPLASFFSERPHASSQNGSTNNQNSQASWGRQSQETDQPSWRSESDIPVEDSWGRETQEACQTSWGSPSQSLVGNSWGRESQAPDQTPWGSASQSPAEDSWGSQTKEAEQNEAISALSAFLLAGSEPQTQRQNLSMQDESKDPLAFLQNDNGSSAGQQQTSWGKGSPKPEAQAQISELQKRMQMLQKQRNDKLQNAGPMLNLWQQAQAQVNAQASPAGSVGRSLQMQTPKAKAQAAFMPSRSLQMQTPKAKAQAAFMPRSNCVVDE
jgi:hypothetical protein